ncbi:MAG: hypothetical protein AAF415_02550 [Pseudomonadota bacterium]
MAFFKGSDYELTPLFEPAEDGTEIFRGLRARRIRNPEAVLEHTVALKERLDSVAHEYFGQPRGWRWMVEANPDVLFPEDLLWDTPDGSLDDDGRERLGHVILIPRRSEVG